MPATTAFGRWLALDPKAALPPGTSPKITRPFTAAQDQAKGREPIKVKWALPGGAIFDSRSPHYRDLLDNYYLPQTHFDAPYAVPEIVAAGESRWEFHR